MSNQVDVSMNAVSGDMPIDLRSVAGSVWRRRFRIIIVTTLLCVLTYLFLMVTPKTYESSASILVENRDNAFVRSTNDSGPRSSAVTDAVVMSSQVELIQSSQTLLRVVRELELANVPEFNGTSSSFLDPLLSLFSRSANQRSVSESKVLALLTKVVTVIRERDSRVVSILVRAQDRDLAAKIANSIANTHVNRRAELSIGDTADASQWLQSEITKLRISVVEAQSAVAEFRIEHDLFVGTNNTSLLDQQLSNIASQITTAQERKNTARSRATLIRNLLDAGQPIDGVSNVQNSVVIQRLSQDKARLQGERAQLLATLLSNHPQVRAITAQINEVDQQILQEGRRVADSMMAEAGVEESLITSLQDDLARLKVSASTAATSNVELQELEREAKAQSDLLQTYLLRFREATARADSGAVLPDVRVVTLALPALKAASPKSTMILIAVAIVSIAVQVGGILFSELSLAVPVVSHAKRDDQDRFDVPPAPAPAPAPAPPVFPASHEAIQEYDEAHAEAEPIPDPVHGITHEPARASVHRTVVHRTVVHKETDAPVALDKAEKDAEEGSVTSSSSFASVAPRGANDEYLSTQNPSDASPDQSISSRQTSRNFCDLSDALCSGNENVVFITSYDRNAECSGVRDMLMSDIMDSGRSVAIVDAGSEIISARLGVSDLAAGNVDFGEIVFPSESRKLTEIYWGTRPVIDLRSDKPAVLIDALCDISDVVIVFAGSVGVASNLPLFTGVQGTLALVAGTEPDSEAVENALNDAARLGFERSSLLIVAKQQANVA